MQFQYEYNGQQYTVDLEASPDDIYRAVIGDREYTFAARQGEGGRWHLTLNGVSSTAYTAVEGAARYVQVDGVVYPLTVPESRSRRRRGGGSAEDSQLTAQMPGQVVDVLVAVGDGVASGQALVVLEAMKMEIRVAAPQDGTVKQVFVEKGQIVERGQKLLEIDAAQADSAESSVPE